MCIRDSPTANLQVDCSDKLIPSEGVYAVYVYVEGKKWAGIDVYKRQVQG